jgi:hypothetical protein
MIINAQSARFAFVSWWCTPFHITQHCFCECLSPLYFNSRAATIFPFDENANFAFKSLFSSLLPSLLTSFLRFEACQFNTHSKVCRDGEETLLTLLFSLLPLFLAMSFGDLSMITTEKGFFEWFLMTPERCWLAAVMSCRRCFAVLRQCGRSLFGSVESLYAMSSFDSGISI